MTETHHEEKYQMAKNTSATGTPQRASRLLQGKVTPVLLVLAAKAFTLVAVLAIYYVIVFFAAVRVVPLTMGFVKSGSGVTLDMPLETVLSAWIAPALFLVALEFVLVLVTLRALWRLRTKGVAAVSRWALGVETAKAETVQAMPLTSKSARKQNTNTTKAA
jgi:hypothetical protein